MWLRNWNLTLWDEELEVVAPVAEDLDPLATAGLELCAPDAAAFLAPAPEPPPTTWWWCGPMPWRRRPRPAATAALPLTAAVAAAGSGSGSSCMSGAGVAPGAPGATTGEVVMAINEAGRDTQ